MKSFRDKFYQFFLPLTVGLSLPKTFDFAARPPTTPKTNQDELTQTSNDRPQKMLVIWVGLIIALSLVTLLAVFGLHYLSSSYKPGIVIGTIIWALFFGVCILFFLPPKFITTIFGGLAGIGINEIGTSTGLITKANKALTNIASQIGDIINGSSEPLDPFITAMVWLFFGLLCLTCLPAFFRDK